MTHAKTNNDTNRTSSSVLVRLMLPDDANPGGTVHGGTILQMMEQAGAIAATRYIASHQQQQSSQLSDSTASHNDKKKSSYLAALVRLEHMRFWQPLHVGQLASVSADLIFTSPHSMLFRVTVSAEDVSNGQLAKKVTNTGDLWFVAMESSSDANHDKDVKVMAVPPMEIPSEATAAWKHYQEGLRSYQTRKAQEKAAALPQDPSSSMSPLCLASTTSDCMCSSCRTSYTPSEEGRSPQNSLQTIHRVVLPSDLCSGSHPFAAAGFVMKEMDNCAGASAVRHARSSRVVTVAIPHIEFCAYVKLGSILNVSSRVVFCSSKSMEVQVTATVTTMDTIHNHHHHHSAVERGEDAIAEGIYTFVSLNDKYQPTTVPPLSLETEEEMERFFKGQKMYEAAKTSRATIGVSSK